jgi:Outer membrane protein LpxR
MLRNFVATLAVTLSPLGPGLAEAQALDSGPAPVASPSAFQFPVPTGRQALGYGRLTSNDLIGDGNDRWRTGSVTMSRAWGYEWNGKAPAQLGELLETRAQGQIIAPANLRKVNLKDRPYAGVLSFGLHSQAAYRGIEYSLGADLVIIGPQTRIGRLQKGLHKLVGAPVPGDSMLALQIGNTFRPTVVGEAGRTYRLGNAVDVRPFAEMRAGDETLLRVGADFSFGSVGKGEMMSRESITGQRYRVIYRSEPGYSMVVGGDMAYVANSVYLPENRGFVLTARRDRLRAGVHWQGDNASAFYGLTYLGREFTGQPQGQVTGSIRIKLRF